MTQVVHADYLMSGGGEKTGAGAGSVIGAMTLFEPGYGDDMEISATGNPDTLYLELWGLDDPDDLRLSTGTRTLYILDAGAGWR